MIRKSEADSLPLHVSDEWKPGHYRDHYIAKATAFFCSKGYDMLNVDVSYEGEVVARYFADPVTKEYKGFLIGRPWGRIKLRNLIQKAAGLDPILKYSAYYYGMVEEASWDWDTKSRLEGAIGLTLGVGLDKWENDIESERYYSATQRKYERLQERISQLMRPAPEGFKEWMSSHLNEKWAVHRKEILGDHIYQCTECKGMWVKKKYKYRGKRQVTCPLCGEMLTATSMAEPKERVGFYLFQTCNDGTARWYERYITGFRMWNFDENEWETQFDDMNLAVIPTGHRYGKLYYREGQGYSESSYNGQLPRMGKGFIYPDFGGAEELMSDHQAHCLKAISDRELYVNANKVIIGEENPGLEYLLKGRYDKLAMELIQDSWRISGTNSDATSIQDYLGLDKQRCLRLRQLNGGSAVLAWLKYEKMTGRKVSAEDMDFFIKYKIDANDTFYGTRKMLEAIPSPPAFRHYLQKQSALSGETFLQVINTYNDYHRMAKAQGLNLNSMIFLKPKDLRAAHDECVRVAHESEYEEKAKKIAEKFPDVPRILTEIQKKYTYQGDEFAIVVPEKIEDIVAEGRALGHCIDTTERYFDRIQKHVTYLVFLRKKSSIRTSWYTLEIEPGGTVRQQRTTGNRQNKEDTEAYMPFIREWQQVVRTRISEEDREAARRSREIRIAEYKELREKKEPVRNGLLAGRLLVDVLEEDLVEAI